MMRSTLGRVGIAVMFCTSVLAGCSSSSRPAPLQTSPDGSTNGSTKIQAIPHPGDVLAYDVTWNTSKAIGTELDVDCKGLNPWTVSDSVATQAHHVFLMGLVSATSCTLKGHTAQGSASTTINVGALPSYLPNIDLTVPAAAGTIAPGWTLIDLTNEQTKVPYSVALVDPQGRYRWYYQYPSTVPGNDDPVIQYQDGVVVGGRALPITYITWQGQIVWKGPEDGTHEVRPAETPGDFYYIPGVACPKLQYGGDAVAEYDSAKNTDIWQWNLCDHYTPPEDVPDWSHMNTVSLFPDKKHLLVSSRDQNEIYKVDRATGNIVWKMGWGGEPGSDPFNGDFTIATPDRFYHQHDTTVLPNGHIMMFDNGHFPNGTFAGRPYSRGLEVAYTFNPSGGSKAHVVWQFRHNPDIFAPIWGSLQRFSNGNTLIDFGERGAEVPNSQSTVDEVSASSKVLWEFVMPVYWGIYRAERIPAQQGFVVHTASG